jgi:mannose-6-phosphate isomerase-like protein (cupin superfamily)
MYVTAHAQQQKAGLPGLEHVTLAGHAEGLSRLSVWQQSFAPGAATPPHRHDCEEVVVVKSGSGELHVEGKVIAFGPDSTITVPSNVLHQIFNTGATPLEITAALSASPVEVFLPDGARLDLPWRT